MYRTFEQAISDVCMLLRDEPPCTTADLTDCAVLYLEGDDVKGVFLSADEPDELDGPFVVDACFVGHVQDNLNEWFENPHFTHRPQLREWTLDAPPVESHAE